MNDHRCTASGNPAESQGAAPTERKLADGQHADHWVLCEAERAKGFVRPVRRSYKHVGRRLCGKPGHLELLLPPGKVAWVCSLAPGHEDDCWAWSAVSSEERDRLERTGTIGGCGTVTTMGQTIAETYAAKPSFYGATFCAGCGDYFPVGAGGEFIWVDDGTRVGT